MLKFLQFIDGKIHINVLLSFAFGVVFIMAMLLFALLRPEPSSFEQWVFITVLALAAAGVGSVIPGLLNFEHRYFKAGGAIALFMVVFLMKPAIVTAVARINPPAATPESAIGAYLSRIDANDFEGAWALLDPEARRGVARDKATYLQAYDTARKPLGEATTRSLIGVQEYQSPAGYPSGVYRVLGYQTRFGDGTCREERVVARGTTDRVWRVFEHVVSTIPMPCLKT